MLNFKKFSLNFLAETKNKTPEEMKVLLEAAWDKLNGWQRALLLGGRGAGKTRAGAEWVRAQVKAGHRKIALVAANFTQARDVMLYGESGLLNIGHPSERPKFIASRRCLEWPCGAVAKIFSAEAPDGLRGSQFDAAWADEFCAWNHAEETLSNLRLALRLDTPDGRPPQLVVTTTPRPSAELIELKAAKGVVTHTLRKAENAHHLARGFLETMEAQYGGTPLGMQELEGQIVTEWPGALWSLSTIAKTRENTAPDLDRIVIALDPPTTSGSKSDACGIIVAGEKRRAARPKVQIPRPRGCPRLGHRCAVDAGRGDRAGEGGLSRETPAVPISQLGRQPRVFID